MDVARAKIFGTEQEVWDASVLLAMAEYLDGDKMKGSEAEACEATMKACIPKVSRVEVLTSNNGFVFWDDVEVEFKLIDDCQTLQIMPKRRSEITKDLHSPKYRQRVKPGKKPKGPSLEDMLKEAENE